MIDDLVPRSPIDRTAALVIAKGADSTPDMKRSSYIVAKAQPIVWRGTHKTGVDYTGATFGPFIVIGLSLDYPKRWVVRCECGNYEFCRAKAIGSSKNERLKCQECLHLELLIAKNKRNTLQTNAGGK